MIRARGSPDTRRASKKLTRSNDKKLFGVCGGIAEYFDTDPTIVRIAFIVFTLFAGGGLLLYLLSAIVMPSPKALSGHDQSSLPPGR
ncbi:MAG: PspC domain-containing protein [Myxococcota bacterium]